ncbi:MAG: phosphoethanolamine transferase [Helicobacteraceae bacterium]|jgi:glucan phosphoethanolaminetransferase (alkaline phosphatase superfamily)|nr:phosphoethanolamine transferase [Helicobacteraceae bacterium]
MRAGGGGGDIYCFPPAFSFATSTRESAPGILTAATIANSDTKESVVFLSIFKKAGFFVARLTNQGVGMTGESPIAAIFKENADYYEIHENLYKANARLQDRDMLSLLDNLLARNEPKNSLIVLHTYGSHTTFEDRYDEPTFSPTCKDIQFDCGGEHYKNSYDNTIAATDYYLSEVMKKFRDKNAVLIYTSDHGTRLSGFKMHAPNQMDDPDLRFVPIFVWFSPKFERKELIAKMRQNLDKNISRDIIFHSLLSAGGIDAEIKDENLDIFSPKLKPHSDPYLRRSCANFARTQMIFYDFRRDSREEKAFFVALALALR